MYQYIWLLCLLLLFGCDSKESPPGLTMSEFSLIAEHKANHQTPLTVDFLVVYHKDLAKKLSSLKAGQYFSSIEQLVRDYLTFIDLWRFEIVPGQYLGDFIIELPRRDEVWGGFCFLDYPGEEPHRITLTGSIIERIQLVLGEENVKRVRLNDQVTDLGVKVIVAPLSLCTARPLNTRLTPQKRKKIKVEPIIPLSCSAKKSPEATPPSPDSPPSAEQTGEKQQPPTAQTP